MKTDTDLLRDYASLGSEPAFRELVARYTGLVYSAAVRQVGSPDLGRDVAQNVFADLARKAAPIARKYENDGSLAGWLHRSTRYESLAFLRAERRRQTREREIMPDLQVNAETSPDWEGIGPVLDKAMDSLGNEDRQALLLRFFNQRDFRAVGLALGISEGAAQKRVTRAVEKLRNQLIRLGVATTGATLTEVLSANVIQTAPAGLAAALANAALAGTGAAAGTGLTILKLMTITPSKIVAASLIVALGVAIPASRLRESKQRLHERELIIEAQNSRLDELDRQNRSLSNLLANAGGKPPPSDDHLHELMRLRAEVTSLRKATAEVVATSPVPRQAWTNRGFATPGDALQTLFWNGTHGDLDSTKAAIHFQAAGDQEISSAELKDGINEAVSKFSEGLSNVQSTRIISSDVAISDDSGPKLMQVTFDVATADRGEQVMQLQFFNEDGNWKPVMSVRGPGDVGWAGYASSKPQVIPPGQKQFIAPGAPQ